MKSLIFKLFLTVLGGLFILLFAVPWNYFGLVVPFSGPDYKLGLDLQGGIELDYKVDLEEARTEEDYNQQREDSIVEGLKSVIDKRIATLNINDSIITSASYGDEQHIIVQIPLKGNDALQSSANIERAKDAIGKVVRIEFKELRENITEADRTARKELAGQILTDLQKSPDEFITETQRFQNNNEGIEVGTVSDITSLLTESGATINLNKQNISTSLSEIENTDGENGYLVYKKNEDSFDYIVVDAEPSIWISAEDSQGRVLNDTYFTKASVQYNQAFQPMVELTFNNDGADIFGELTKRLVGQPIAIFVGGELLTSPTVNDAILTGQAVITGNYTPESAQKLATDINTGVVPAPIYLTSERTIDARLGQNSLEKIIYAGMFGFLVILLFLIFTYRLAGFVSAIALFIYIVITLAILKQFGVVLTLASIAGLVLSIGIAIDANILIFERVKDELRQGSTIRESVKIGFEKSFSAIWDANITGLIVALILFVFGINLIKGFGFILGLGIIVSLFSVFFVSRLFIRLIARSDISQKVFIGK
ncbi:protein translocase subunit SecD [Candidatus Gracilibacteria bacterium]|nr:protein translocase subunit SecD [Candidatus Gracilibacteria bacterium]